jgi:two-component system, OmpR family, response regulator
LKLAPRSRQRDAANGRGGPNICGVHILVVEDEPAIADFLQRGLTAEGYSVTTAADGVGAGRLARSGDVDLMILDLMLPGRDGTDVLAEVREARPQLPVIVLTARTETDSKVEVLDLGATDYVTKPFSFEELAARVRAHLRDRDEASSTRLELGDIRMDLVGRRVERAGIPIRLTTTEFDLLAFLMRHPGQVLTRGELLRAVWGYPDDVDSGVVGVYVGYLRRKLAVGSEPAPIETIRSVGYRLQGDG